MDHFSLPYIHPYLEITSRSHPTRNDHSDLQNYALSSEILWPGRPGTLPLERGTPVRQVGGLQRSALLCQARFQAVTPPSALA